MRPAFEKYLGEEGKKMVEGDRKDHGDVSVSYYLVLSVPSVNKFFCFKSVST